MAPSKQRLTKLLAAACSSHFVASVRSLASKQEVRLGNDHIGTYLERWYFRELLTNPLK